MNLATWDEENGWIMAGLKGKSRPPGNLNAFKHGLAAIQKRREESVTTEHEESVRQQILDGLIDDKGGDQHISTATRILTAVIAWDAAWLVVFNGASLTSSTDEFFYDSQGVSIWSSPALLPFSERSWIDSEPPCHGCLAQA